MILTLTPELEFKNNLEKSLCEWKPADVLKKGLGHFYIRHSRNTAWLDWDDSAVFFLSFHRSSLRPSAPALCCVTQGCCVCRNVSQYLSMCVCSLLRASPLDRFVVLILSHESVYCIQVNLNIQQHLFIPHHTHKPNTPWIWYGQFPVIKSGWTLSRHK